MEATVDERRELLAQDLDFAGLEQAITAQMNALGAELVKQVVEPLLVDEDYVERLKGLGGQRGLKFKEYRVVGPLRYGAVDCGQDGLFHQSPPQEWQAAREASAPRGPRGVFGEALGFLGHYSLSLVSEVVEMAVLCPSLAVAQTVLARRPGAECQDGPAAVRGIRPPRISVAGGRSGSRQRGTGGPHAGDRDRWGAAARAAGQAGAEKDGPKAPGLS